jgi:uncharacterized protein with GYD domain
MATYTVLYKFTPEGAKNIRDTVKRTGRIRQANARAGFKVRDVFWTQGPYDMLAIVEAPSEEAMMGAMMNVVGAGNVTSTTMRAFDATEMSRIMAQALPLEAAPPAAAARRDGAKAAPAAAGRKRR